jgi:hypothetical protein
MLNIDNTLETFIMADFSLARLMHKLRRLAIREYRLNNYGECSKRCMNWFKIYSVILPSYVKYTDIFTTQPLNIESANNSDFRFNFIINQLRDTKYKEALYWYTECRKYLVGPAAYCLIEKINTILPKNERYEAFMTYSEIVVADKGLHNSAAHYKYMQETLQILKNVKKYYKLIGADNIMSVLNSISIKPRKVFKLSSLENVKKNDTNKNINVTVNNVKQLYTLPEDNCENKKVDTLRLTYENARVGMIISYATKKGTEYARITKVCKDYVETDRLKLDTNSSYSPHKVAICKVSQNKPAYTRVIRILMD